MIAPREVAKRHITPTGYVVGALQVATWIVGLYWLAKSAIRPDPKNRLKWYDRIIRLVGVLMFGTFLLFGIPYWLGLVDYFK
jgi:uncharacterized membrane protein YfbV (UPF0208 family)